MRPAVRIISLIIRNALAILVNQLEVSFYATKRLCLLLCQLYFSLIMKVYESRYLVASCSINGWVKQLIPKDSNKDKASWKLLYESKKISLVEKTKKIKGGVFSLSWLYNQQIEEILTVTIYWQNDLFCSAFQVCQSLSWLHILRSFCICTSRANDIPETTQCPAMWARETLRKAGRGQKA